MMSLNDWINYGMSRDVEDGLRAAVRTLGLSADAPLLFWSDCNSVDRPTDNRRHVVYYDAGGPRGKHYVAAA